MATTQPERPKLGATQISMRNNRPSHQSGYLLLEACLALAITAVILTAIFKITDWNLRVSQDSINTSNEHIKESSLFSFLDRAFLEMSGDAVIELQSNETSTHYLSELIIQNSSKSFTWPNQPFTTKAVKIITRPNRDKTLDIVIEYYSEYLLKSPYERNAPLVLPDQEPIQTLTLLEDIWRFEWRAWDGQKVDREGKPLWEYSWETSVQSPRYFELNAMFTPETPATIHTFWNPRKVNPTVYFQVQQKEKNSN